MKHYLERWQSILKIAWPLIVANSFWNIQLTVDRVFLGNYSTEALGAAMAVMGVFWVPMALLQQTAAYLMTFVAQYFGAKEFNRIGAAVWQATYLSLFGGVLFLLLIPLAPPLFKMMGHSLELQAIEIEYFISICFSALPTALVAVASAFYTGLGRTQMIMWINGVGVLTNILFDYLLIFGKMGFPALGVSGAGYATTLAAWASAIFGFYIMLSKSNELTYLIKSQFQLNLTLMKRFLRYGLPSGLQWSLEGLAFTVFLIIIGRFPNGDAALASSGIAVTVMMLSILPAMGVAQAVSVLVGQHLGEKNPHLAEKDTYSGVQVSLIYILIMSMSFLIFPEFYLSWFKNEKNLNLWSEVSVIVPYLLMYVAVFTTFDSLNLNLSFALKGAGDTRFVSIVALLIPWPLMVLPTWLFRDYEGAIYYAWGAAAFYGLCQASVFLLRFRQGRWKSMSVIH